MPGTPPPPVLPVITPVRATASDALVAILDSVTGKTIKTSAADAVASVANFPDRYSFAGADPRPTPDTLAAFTGIPSSMPLPIVTGDTSGSVPLTQLLGAMQGLGLIVNRTSIGPAPVNTSFPIISGPAQVGQTLMATTGTWTNSPTSFTFQWNRAGTPIGGATASSYVPVVGDIGNVLTVSVIAINPLGTSAAVVSAATLAVVAVGAAPVNAGLPVISGPAQVGQLLMGTTGFWTNSPTTFSYQWNRAGTPIGGATTSSYIPVVGDIGNVLTLSVTATNGFGTSAAAVSAGTVAVVAAGAAPVNTGLPAISGAPQVGQLLATTTGTWSNSPASFAYQWNSAGVAILGATASTYVPVPADVGNAITVSVIATNAFGSSTAATSAGTSAVVAAPSLPSNITLPTISGPAQQGQTLSVAPGTWTNAPTSFAYQWNSAGTPIAGATGGAYIPVSGDVGNTITVTVTASNIAGAGLPATSAATSAVIAAGVVPVNTGLPIITGAAQVGQTLTTTNGTWANAPTSFTYQWNRGGSPIVGATASSYVPVSADVGSTLTVSVIATNSIGSSSVAMSAATVAVVIVSSVPVNTALPTISGAAQVGQTLTASSGAWSNSPSSFAYQWYNSAGTNITIGWPPATTPGFSGGGGTGFLNASSGIDGAGAALSASATINSLSIYCTNASGNIILGIYDDSGAGGQAGNLKAKTASTAVIGGWNTISVITPTVLPAGTYWFVLAVDNNNASFGDGSGTNGRRFISGQPYAMPAVCPTLPNTNPNTIAMYASLSLAGLGAIAGATASTYTPVAGDVGKTLTVSVVATNSIGASAPATSGQTVAVVAAGGVPVNTILPTITGAAQVGQTLTAHSLLTDWSPNATSLTYQWNGNGVAIGGATASTYVPVAGDVGHSITVSVVGVNGSGSSTPATSAATVIAVAGVPVNSGLPVISGTAQVGQTLTTTNGAWTNTPTGFTYQWNSTAAPSSTFSVSGGKIFDPNGKVWHGQGAGILNQEISGIIGTASGAALANRMRSMLPGINLVRIACYTFDTPATFASFINVMTAAKVVCVLENHDASVTVYTGSRLTNESNWYASLAAYYLGNPYVWFQTMNEPGSNDSLQMQATYNAVRGTGNNTIVVMEAGAGSDGNVSTVGTNVFGSMRNIAWDVHAYNWMSGYSTNVATITADANSRISGMQTITSADGTMPVMCLETGNSSNGTTVDVGGVQEIQAAYTNPNFVGVAAWIFDSIYSGNGAADNLTNPGGTVLNAFGRQVAALIAPGASAFQSSTYVPVAADIGNTLTVTIIASNSSGSSAPATSAATAAVAPASVPVNTAIPTISGTAGVGATLTSSNGAWTNNPTSFAYQWKSNGVNVGTSIATYAPVSGDIGHTITCSVTASNAAGASAAATSMATAAVTSVSVVPATRIDSLMSILGVSAHAGDYAGLNGASTANIVADAQYLGIRKWRDGFTGLVASSRELAIYQALVNAGLSIIGLPWPKGDSVIVNNVNSAKLVAGLGPKALFALEGPNEPGGAGFGFNYNGVFGGGGSSWASVAAWTRDWYAAVKADSTLKNTLVMSGSLIGAEVGNYGMQYLTIPAGPPAGVLMPAGTVYADAINLHLYPMFQGQAQTIDQTKDTINAQLGADFVLTYANGYAGYTLVNAQSKTLAITEFGYAAVGGSPGSTNIDITTAAKCTLNAFLNAWNQGYIALCIYTFYEDAPDGGPGFGLMNGPGNPKTSGLYLHNLVTPLIDAGASASTFAPGAIGFSLTGMPTNGLSQLFQKSNGRYELIIWNNIKNYNFATGAPIAIAPTNVTLTLSATPTTINVYDPTVQAMPVSTVSGTAAVTIGLKDYPMIIEVIP